MQRAVTLILVLALAAGIYFLAIEGGDDPDPNGTDLDQPDVDNDKGVGLDPMKATYEGPMPKAAMQALQSSGRLLMIGKNKESWNLAFLQACGVTEGLSYRSWFLDDPSAGGAGAEGPSRGMTALEAKPTADYLETEDVTVLVLDTIDPNALPMSFWNVASQRVTSGAMGLFVRPSFPSGPEGVSPSEHPLLSHPVVKELLPVKSAALLTGTPVPGVFAEAQTLMATEQGREHPATRLVPVPAASAEMWRQATTGDGRLATRFCYPVEDLQDGALTLVECQAGITLPAIIVSSPKSTARVLWMGNVDFTRRAHLVQAKDRVQKLFVNHSIVWLAGQAP